MIPEFPKTQRGALKACDSSGFSPLQVVLGGGQEAMDVTTTSTRIGKFEARLVLSCGKWIFREFFKFDRFNLTLFPHPEHS